MTTLFDFILEIVAVFLGVLGAFELDNYREARTQDKERVRVLILIRQEVDANQELINSTNSRIEPTDVLNHRSVRDIWDGVSSKLVVLRDNDLLHQVTLLYFDLASFDRIIEVYNEHARPYQYATVEEKARMKPELTRQLVHLKSYGMNLVLPQITKVLKLIDAELGREKIGHVPKSNTKTEKAGAPGSGMPGGMSGGDEF